MSASPDAETARRRLAAAGCLLAATGILLGAFAAHGLRAGLTPEALGWWQTGVQYQLWNAVGLVALAALQARGGLGGWLILAGTILFSASLYVMALTGERWLGMVTPLGGALMIAGWLVAAWQLSRQG